MKVKKILLSVFISLCFILVFSTAFVSNNLFINNVYASTSTNDVWNGTANIAWYINGEGSFKNPYQISTAEDLAGLMEITNIGEDGKIAYNGDQTSPTYGQVGSSFATLLYVDTTNFLEKYLEITNDINLNTYISSSEINENSFTNIYNEDKAILWMGIGTRYSPFRGTLNGNNYNISGIVGSGLFNYIGAGAIIHNVIIGEGYLYSLLDENNNYYYLGSIFNNISEYDFDATEYEHTKIFSCINNATINSTLIAGGIGGVINASDVNVEIAYCQNNGYVYVNNLRRYTNYGYSKSSGGIIGYGYSYSNLSIIGCVNNNEVCATVFEDITYGKEDVYIGGIIGYIEGSTNNDSYVKLHQCLNLSNIYETNNDTDEQIHLGQICGISKDCDIRYSYFDRTICDIDGIGNTYNETVVGLTTEQLKSNNGSLSVFLADEFKTLKDYVGTEVWLVNDGEYPILNTQNLQLYIVDYTPTNWTWAYIILGILSVLCIAYFIYAIVFFAKKKPLNKGLWVIYYIATFVILMLYLILLGIDIAFSQISFITSLISMIILALMLFTLLNLYFFSKKKVKQIELLWYFPMIFTIPIAGFIIFVILSIKHQNNERLLYVDKNAEKEEDTKAKSTFTKEQSIDISIDDVPELIVEKSKETTYKDKIKELFENETITEDKYDLYCYYINDKKYDKIELSEEDRQEVIADYEAVAINLYKEQLSASKGKKTTGNLLKKNKLICNICFGVGSGLLALGIILALAVNGVAGGIIGVIGVVGLFVGFSGMSNRRKICPNCGECWGEKIDSTYMGSSQKTVQKHITKAEYDRKVKGSDSWVGTDGKGNYFERTIETTSNYVDTLKCPNCGHTWKIKESQKD